MNVLNDDVLQLISQYCPKVYCTLRLVCKDVKKIIDEVLPMGLPNDLSSTREFWREKFLRNSEWCGFKLLDGNDFDEWIEAMYGAYGTDEKYAGRLEKFCRDYLKNGLIGRSALHVLCKNNRSQFVRSLWKDAVDKKSRFYSNCIQEICMLDDLEFVKMVYHEFCNDETPEEAMKTAIKWAIEHSRWQNVGYLIEQRPALRDCKEWKYRSDFRYVANNWDSFLHLLSCGEDKEAIIEVLKRNPPLLRYVNESLLKDKQFIVEVGKTNSLVLVYAHDSLRKDKEIVMGVIKNNGNALRYCDYLQTDREIAMAAVKQNGISLQLVHESFQTDKEIALEAVKRDSHALSYVDESLLMDKDIILEAVRKEGYLVLGVHESLMKDKDIVMAAVKQDGPLLPDVDESFRKDKDIVMAAVKQDGLLLAHADESLKKDKDIVMAAVKQNGDALQFADESLRKDIT